MSAPTRPEETRATHGRLRHTVAAGVPLVLGLVAAGLSWHLGLGSLADPGPGLWPLMVSVGMAVTALVVLASRPAASEERFGRGAVTVAIAVVSLIGYALLFERVGFEIPTVALLVLWCRVLGRESWRIAAAVAVGATAAVYLLFITGLGVSLPHIVHT